jgi:hypothetical protein
MYRAIPYFFRLMRNGFGLIMFAACIYLYLVLLFLFWSAGFRIFLQVIDGCSHWLEDCAEDNDQYSANCHTFVRYQPQANPFLSLRNYTPFVIRTNPTCHQKAKSISWDSPFKYSSASPSRAASAACYCKPPTQDKSWPSAPLLLLSWARRRSGSTL